MHLGGFSYQEKLMMLTSTANDSEFDKIADVMILQHATKHHREIKDRSQRVQWNSRWNGRKSVNVAHVAEDCEEDNDPAIADDAEDHDEYEDELEEIEVNDDLEEMELDGFSAFISMMEGEEEPEPQEIADLIQSTTVAYTSWQNAAGKLGGKGRKGDKGRSWQGSSWRAQSWRSRKG